MKVINYYIVIIFYTFFLKIGIFDEDLTYIDDEG
jgi:hypothetical protein